MHKNCNSGTYAEWETDAMHRLKKDLLMTYEYIHDHKHKDDGKVLSSEQLDDVNHIVCILDKLNQHMHVSTNGVTTTSSALHTLKSM